MTSTTSSSSIYGFLVLIGIGAGLSSQAPYSIAAAHAAQSPEFGPSYVPDAIGFMNVAQIGAIVHSLAISGAIFQNYAFNNLSALFQSLGLHFSEDEIRNAVAGVGSAIFEQLRVSDRELGLAAIVSAIQTVYILSIVVGAFGLVCALFLKRERL